MKKYVTIAVVIAVILAAFFWGGFWTGRATLKPPKPDTLIVPPETLSRVDTVKTHDTIFIDGKPLVIRDSTRIGDLPWIPYTSADSFNIFYNQQRFMINFTLKRWVKGRDGGYEFIPEGKTFTIKRQPERQPFPIRPYIALDGDYLLATAYDPAHIRADCEVGLGLWSRCQLHVVAIYDQHIHGGAGIRCYPFR